MVGSTALGGQSGQQKARTYVVPSLRRHLLAEATAGRANCGAAPRFPGT